MAEAIRLGLSHFSAIVSEGGKGRGAGVVAG